VNLTSGVCSHFSLEDDLLRKFLGGSSRFTVCAKSPLTGIWGEGACGGTFGPELKRAGYDGILIVGKAQSPTTLSIIEGEARLIDASDLWGKDIYQTTDLLKKKDKGLKVKGLLSHPVKLVRLTKIMSVL